MQSEALRVHASCPARSAACGWAVSRSLLRGARRSAVLVLSLVACQVRFIARRAWVRVLQRRELTMRERAVWLHQSCRRIQLKLGIALDAERALPARSLIVSNHLSHLDILLYGSLGPVIFVSKKEVQKWPLIGRLATNGGTIFVDRARRVEAFDAARQIEELLCGDLPVVLFPEGTSSDGSQVLPFHPSLFASAIRASAPITAAAIAYAADEVEESELTYWGDKVFAPHLFRTLSVKRLSINIEFAHQGQVFTDRKQAARMMHAGVVQLRCHQKQSTARDLLGNDQVIYPQILPHA